MLGTIPPALLPALPPPPLPALLAPVGAPLAETPLPVLLDADDTPDEAATADDELTPPTPPADTTLLLFVLLLLLLLLTLALPTPPVDCDTTFEPELLPLFIFELLLLLLLAKEEDGLTFELVVSAPKCVDEIILFVTALLELTPLETEFTAVPLLLIALLDETLKKEKSKKSILSLLKVLQV